MLNITRYYISADNEKGFEEITKEEWDAIINEPPVSGYATDVYEGRKTIDEIPEEYREKTQIVVDAKIAKWGFYKDAQISDSEFTEMIKEVL